MKDTYSVMGIKSSADYSSPFMIRSFDRSSTKEEAVKKFCRESMGKINIAYNEHLRVELWLNRENGISELIYEIEK